MAFCPATAGGIVDSAAAASQRPTRGQWLSSYALVNGAVGASRFSLNCAGRQLACAVLSGCVVRQAGSAPPKPSDQESLSHFGGGLWSTCEGLHELWIFHLWHQSSDLVFRLPKAVPDTICFFPQRGSKRGAGKVPEPPLTHPFCVDLAFRPGGDEAVFLVLQAHVNGDLLPDYATWQELAPDSSISRYLPCHDWWA